MKTLVLLICVLLAAPACQAQLYVYHVRGESFVKGRPRPLPLRAQTFLQTGQSVLLRPGAQVVFFDQAGRNMAFTKTGTTTYEGLAQALSASAAGPGRAYLAYVWKSLHQKAPAAEGHSPLGGVSRADTPALLAPLDSAVLTPGVVHLQWLSAAGVPVWVTLTDGTGDPVLQLRLEAPSLDINTHLSRLKRNTIYFWMVSLTPEGATNAPRRAFVVVDAEQLRRQREEVAHLPALAEATGWQRGFQAKWFFELAQP